MSVRRGVPVKARLHRAPLAITSDGTMLANIVEVVSVEDLSAAIEQAAERGTLVFVGVTVSRAEATTILAHLDGAAAEAIAKVVGRQRRRRVTARRRRKTAS